MNREAALVVTTISSPNVALRRLAEGCRQHKVRMIVVGDSRSPDDFYIPDVEFYDLDKQRASGLSYAELCPERHYARKNIGYLLAARAGAEVIVETDDDNIPRPEFWQTRQREQHVEAVATPGWVNVYRYFSDHNIWPRGLPLTQIRQPAPRTIPGQTLDCPIQQGLADENPDVDAIYRLTAELPLNFAERDPLALRPSVWCPFNSQNTTWFRDAFPLMYLPAYCSFRMTDIWRSFVAQRLAWEMGWSVLFHQPTVWQVRNEHDLMRDFADEVAGYLNNELIAETLERLGLRRGAAEMGNNLRTCYDALDRLGLVDDKETKLLEAWISDMSRVTAR